MEAGLQYGAGIVACDVVVQAFHEAMSNGNKVFRDTEASFLREELIARERIMLLDKIASHFSEERRLLEIQLQDCKSQSSHAKKKHAIVNVEVNRFNQLLSQSLAKLEDDEKRLDEQHAAVKNKVQEVLGIASSLDERIAGLQDAERELETSELKLYNREREYESARREMATLEQEIDARRRSLERKEESISTWMKALSARESELAHFQQQFEEELERIEGEEAKIAMSSASGAAAAARQQQTSQLRALMDDQRMAIDRDEDDVESEQFSEPEDNDDD